MEEWNLELLPTECLFLLFSYLDGPVLLNLAMVSKRLSNLCSDQALWRSMYFKRWNISLKASPNPSPPPSTSTPPRSPPTATLFLTSSPPISGCMSDAGSAEDIFVKNASINIWEESFFLDPSGGSERGTPSIYEFVSFNKLVTMVTSPTSIADMELLDTIILMHLYFSTTLNLLIKLFQRYHITVVMDPSHCVAIQHRVCSCIKKIIEFFFSCDNPYLVAHTETITINNAINNTIHHTITGSAHHSMVISQGVDGGDGDHGCSNGVMGDGGDGGGMMQSACNVMVIENLMAFTKTANKAHAKMILHTLQKMFSTGGRGSQYSPMPTPIYSIDSLPVMGTTPRRGDGSVDWGMVDEKIIAMQITILDHNNFTAIKSSEFFSSSWNRPNKMITSPNIIKFISWFGKLAYWVSYEILRVEKLKHRAKVLEKIIKIAQHLRSFQNFNSFVAVMCGIKRTQVYRLKQTFKALQQTAKNTLSELEYLVENNYANLRKSMESTQLPCFPYLGLFLTDLTFIEEGLPTYSDDGNINLSKLTKISNIIRTIQQYQRVPYPFQPVKDLLEYFEGLDGDDDDSVLYALSRLWEPARKDSIPKI